MLKKYFIQLFKNHHSYDFFFFYKYSKWGKTHCFSSFWCVYGIIFYFNALNLNDSLNPYLAQNVPSNACAKFSNVWNKYYSIILAYHRLFHCVPQVKNLWSITSLLTMLPSSSFHAPRENWTQLKNISNYIHIYIDR